MWDGAAPRRGNYGVGMDGCVTAHNLDCVGSGVGVDGTCEKCGVRPGSKCCENTNQFGVGSDGCDTSNNLDCVEWADGRRRRRATGTCEKCGVEEGLKCCDRKRAYGVGKDGCSSEFVCRDEKCRNK